MNSQEILALTPGTALDAAVNTFIFGGANPEDKFSTNDAAAAKILDRLSLFVGRVDSGPKLTPGRPWLAGILGWDGSVNGYVTRLSVAAPTRNVALCKAALLVMFQPAKTDRVKSEATSEEAARELAARIGTPGARSPAAGAAAAKAAADKRTAAKALKEAKEAKKAARLAGKGRAGLPNPAPAAPPVAGAGRPQPAVFTSQRGPRQPMPSRPTEFKPPTPLATGGNDAKS